MGQQALAISGLVLFALVLAGHFGARLADRRERQTAAVVLAALALLAAILVVPWELAMYSRDGLAIRKFLAVCWAIVSLLLGRRLFDLVGNRQARSRGDKTGGRSGGY